MLLSASLNSRVRRFVVNFMTRLSINFLFLFFAFGYAGLINNYSQDLKVSSGWKKVHACGITFLVPKTLKNKKAQGFDSCVAIFRNSKVYLAIDSGWYGSVSSKSNTSPDFKEEFIEIDGKKAQLATYVRGRSNSDQQFFARIYVALSEPRDDAITVETTSLNMTVQVRSEKELETAKQIFQSIRFVR